MINFIANNELMNIKHTLILTSAILGLNTVMNAQQYKYPQTHKENVVDDYFGVKVSDPYRWLENDTSAQTADWVKRQQDFTNAFLRQLPYRDQIIARLKQIWNYPKFSAPSKHGDYYLIYRNDGLQ